MAPMNERVLLLAIQHELFLSGEPHDAPDLALRLDVDAQGIDAALRELLKMDRVVETSHGYIYGSKTSVTKGWCQTHSGKKVFPWRMNEDDIDIVDIAHGLRIPRFTAHTCVGGYTYAVAQHSFHASFLGSDDPKKCLAKLLHDGHEYVLNDLSRPIRRQLEMSAYNAACERLQKKINRKFGLDPEAHHDPDVVFADNTMLAVEKRDLMAPAPEPWSNLPEAPTNLQVYPWSPQQAVNNFLSRFHELMKAIENNG